MNIKKFLVAGLLAASSFTINSNPTTAQANDRDTVFQHKIDVLFIHLVGQVIHIKDVDNKKNFLEKYKVIADLRPLVSDKGLNLLNRFLKKENISSIDEVMNIPSLKQQDNA